MARTSKKDDNPTAPLPSWYYYVVVRMPRRKVEDFKAKFLKDRQSVAPPKDIQGKITQASDLRLDLLESQHLGKPGDAKFREIHSKLTKLEDEVMAWIEKEYR